MKRDEGANRRNIGSPDPCLGPACLRYQRASVKDRNALKPTDVTRLPQDHGVFRHDLALLRGTDSVDILLHSSDHDRANRWLLGPTNPYADPCIQVAFYAQRHRVHAVTRGRWTFDPHNASSGLLTRRKPARLGRRRSLCSTVVELRLADLPSPSPRG